MNKLLLSLCLCLIQFPVLADMPEPYKSIKLLPFDGHGWFINAEHLQGILDIRKPKTVIEVGSWLGCSTRFIAGNLPEGGVIYAVDTWRGSINEPEHQKDPRLSYLYQLFLSNIIQTGLTERVIPVRMESIEASKALNVQAELIYIDGAHDTASVYNDIMAWYPHLQEGGVMCGDDWGWISVQNGVVQAANALNRRVLGYKNFWWFDP